MANSTTAPRPTRTFKGGTTPITTRVETYVVNDPSPFGIVTPLRLPDKIGDTFKMTTNPVDGIIDDFKNMLLTNYGERVGKPDFGANLQSLLTERLSRDDWDESAGRLIRQTTDKYMRGITINNVLSAELQAQNDGFSRTMITVIYSIPTLGIQDRRLEINLVNVS